MFETAHDRKHSQDNEPLQKGSTELSGKSMVSKNDL